jgi:hypothetical protein
LYVKAEEEFSPIGHSDRQLHSQGVAYVRIGRRDIEGNIDKINKAFNVCGPEFSVNHL